MLDRSRARPARHVHRDAGDFLGETGAERHLPSRVWSVAGLPGVAVDELLHLSRLDPCPVEGLLRGHHAELDRGDLRQRAQEVADGRARPFDDDRPFHASILASEPHHPADGLLDVGPRRRWLNGSPRGLCGDHGAGSGAGPFIRGDRGRLDAHLSPPVVPARPVGGGPGRVLGQGRVPARGRRPAPAYPDAPRRPDIGRARLAFRVPQVPPGEYGIAPCASPCGGWTAVGDLVGSWFTVGSPVERQLEAVRRSTSKELRTLLGNQVQAQRWLTAQTATLRDLVLRLERGRGTDWALVTGWAMAGVLAATALALALRRRRSA